MEKKIFIEAIEALEKQDVYDNKVSINLGDVFPNAYTSNLRPDNSVLFDMLIKILQIENNDSTDSDESIIVYYIYEISFGFEYEAGCYTDGNGNNIDISDAGKLYDYLNKEKVWI